MAEQDYEGQASNRVIAKGWLISRSMGWRSAVRYVLQILSLFLVFFVAATVLIPLVGLALRMTIDWWSVLLSFALMTLAGFILVAHEVRVLRRSQWQPSADDPEYAAFAGLKRPRVWQTSILFAAWVAFLTIQILKLKL